MIMIGTVFFVFHKIFAFHKIVSFVKFYFYIDPHSIKIFYKLAEFQFANNHLSIPMVYLSRVDGSLSKMFFCTGCTQEYPTIKTSISMNQPKLALTFSASDNSLNFQYFLCLSMDSFEIV